jgi:uncharacterized protein YkwD
VSVPRRLLASAIAAVVLVVPATADAKAPSKEKAAAVQDCADADVMPTAQNVELIRAAVLCLHNQVRAQRGLPRLKANPKLRSAANAHSSDMVDGGYFDHTSPSGETFVDRVLDAGYAKRDDFWTLGENLAWGTGDESTPRAVMNAWMNSAGHKANLLKRSYRELGIGVSLGVPSDAGVGATFTAEFGAKA